jgi:hypothetical protein
VIPADQSALFEVTQFLPNSQPIRKILEVRHTVAEKMLDVVGAHHFPRWRFHTAHSSKM